MRRLGLVLVGGLLLLAPAVVAAEPDSGSPGCVDDAACPPAAAVDAAQVEDTAAAAADPSDAVDLAQPTPTPTPGSETTRTIAPVTVVQSPFAAPVTQSAPAETIAPQDPSRHDRLPPGPPNRWP
jgi:hypothetical protein